MNLLERIKKLAKDKDISIYQLEEEINIGRNTVYQWNKRTPSSDKLEAIADYFNVSVDYLLGREEKKVSKNIDLSEDDTVFSFDGKEISKETMRKAIAIAKALEENE